MSPMSPRLLRPRASGGFDPRTIANLALWLDASDGSTMTPANPSDGTTISEWRSKVGSITVAQGSAGAQPTLTANYFSGRSALTFDGGDVLSTASSGITLAPSSLFIVFDETTAVTAGGLFVAMPSSGNDFSAASAFLVAVHDPTASQIYSISQITAAASTALAIATNMGTSAAFGKRLLSVVLSASSGAARLNGVEDGTDSVHAVSGTSPGLLIGGRYLSGAINGSFRFNGRICEILQYSRQLSAEEIASVEKYLSSRWGVSL